MSLKNLLSWTLSVAAITVSIGAHAATPTFQDQVKALVTVAPAKGERADFQQYTNFFYKKGTSFDTSVEREVSYLSVIGVLDVNGVFVPQMLSTVTEKWEKSPVGWNVSQLIREATLDGRIYKTLASVLVFEGEGRVKDIVRLTPPDANADQAAFEQEIDAWTQEILK